MEHPDIEGDGAHWIGEVIEFASVRALPPGYRCMAVFESETGSYQTQAKVVGVTRLESGRYQLRIKLLNLTKDDRTRLNDLTSFLLLLK